MLQDYIVLIPSYKPDVSLFDFLARLNGLDFYKIVVINDGSDQAFYKPLNDKARFGKIEVIHHATNLGKGRSLKTGVNHIMVQHPQCLGIVTADADGQHCVDDIQAVAKKLSETKSDLTLGCRDFDVKTPLKSRIGNTFTTFIFRFLVGLKIKDTQTGLRGLSKSIFSDLMRISGERYEYETNMLLAAKNSAWSLANTSIKTIYIENNKSSHFNPILDSMRIYFLIIRFFFSSIFSSALDLTFFTLFIKFDSSVLVAVFGARLLSGWINFYLNKNLVFRTQTNFAVALIRYWALVLFMGSVSYSLVLLLQSSFTSIVVLKLLIESVLFLISFAIQKEFVFIKNKQVSHNE